MKHKVIIFLKIVLLIGAGLYLFSFDYRIISFGLESSHYFATNYLPNNNFIFGKDYIWTYGPFGFLIRPVDIASNLSIAFLFQALLWTLFFGILIYTILKYRTPILQLILFILFFYLSRMVYAGGDYFICLLVALCLSIACRHPGKKALFLLALLLTVLLWFIKFDCAFLATSAIVTFLLISVIVNRRQSPLIAVSALLFSPLLFTLIYRIYSSSYNIIPYLRGVYELSAGYSIASVAGDNRDLILAVLFIIIFFLLTTILYRSDRRSFYFSLTMILPIFIAFKRGFVRQDTHIITFFSFFLGVLAIVLLSLDSGRSSISGRPLIAGKVMIGLLISLCPIVFFLKYPFYLSGGRSFNQLIPSLQYVYHREAVAQRNNHLLAELKLEDPLLEGIGDSSVGIFPWEISYLAANKFDFRPFPVIHLYDAYTPYLDRLNASFLDSSDQAPEFILFEWKSIDGRHPLIDVPALWLTLYKWYDLDQRFQEMLLLRRRAQARFSEVKHNYSTQGRVGEYINIPSSEHPVIMELGLELNAIGILRKILFRIPEVRMQLSDSSGVIGDYRVIPDTLADGLLVNSLPLGLEGVSVLLNQGKIQESVIRFEVYGEGARFYKPEISLDFYEIPGIVYSSS